MIPELGIIEGYFGRSWSWADRAAVIKQLAPAGYRFFHYAPKIDTKLRRNWQQLYEPSEIAAIEQFSAECKAHKIRFGVGLTPYGAHLDFNDDVRSQLKAKLAQLDALGINDLAILFDDMRGDLPDLAQIQSDIVAFVSDNSKARHFFMCPSYYSNDPVLDRVFGQRPDSYLETLGKRIDKMIPIYWTGEEVCSAEYRPGHLEQISAQLQRKLALWDNYPVNDGPRMSNYLHLRAFTGRPATLGKHVSHHAINPASQPILGCIPALTLPRSYALGDAYCYGDEFLSAAISVCGEELALMLQKDMLRLQESGLDRLGDGCESLSVKYSAIDHPAAREVVDWLSNGYAITGEMLQTQ
jgi:hyaluronoglucosaminidase